MFYKVFLWKLSEGGGGRGKVGGGGTTERWRRADGRASAAPFIPAKEQPFNRA